MEENIQEEDQIKNMIKFFLLCFNFKCDRFFTIFLSPFSSFILLNKFFIDDLVKNHLIDLIDQYQKFKYLIKMKILIFNIFYTAFDFIFSFFL
jgi:hypothetical protein